MNVNTPLYQRLIALGIRFVCLAWVLVPMRESFADIALPLGPNNAYDFTEMTVGETLALPGSYANAWMVLNPQTQGEETSNQTLPIEQADGETTPFLGFSGMTLGKNAYLCFKIGTYDATTKKYTPYALAPAVDNNIVPREIILSMRFSPTDAQSAEDLLTLYKEYDDRNNYVTPLAAKLGLYVGDDGYFYVARVSLTGEVEDPNTMHQYEWVKTAVRYTGGRVDVRFLSWTYRTSGSADSLPEGVTAYSIYVKTETSTDAVWTCLTAGVGYKWEMEPTMGVYMIDFETLGKGEWLYALDATSLYADATAFSSLNAIGFSATAGGLYSASMNEFATIATLASLSSYSLGRFEPYVDLASANYSLFADWAMRYNVRLENYLTKTSTYQLYSMTDSTEDVFNAFLLDMDPAVETTQKLYVTAVAPKANTMVLTVEGPEGCSLQSATQRAGRLYIKRATTLADLATAEAQPVDEIVGATIGYDEGAVLLTLPRKNSNGEDLAFASVTLEAVEIE